jgi:hypothetical protein
MTLTYWVGLYNHCFYFFYQQKHRDTHIPFIIQFWKPSIIEAMACNGTIGVAVLVSPQEWHYNIESPEELAASIAAAQTGRRSHFMGIWGLHGVPYFQTT